MQLARLYHADCRDLCDFEIPDGCVDAVITDPPYGDTSLGWDKKVQGWVERAARALKPSGCIWVCGSMRFLAPLFAEMQAHGFRYSQDLVWRKQNGTGFHADRFRRVHEHAVMWYRGKWADVYHDPQFTLDARKKTARRKTRPTHTGHINRGHYVSEDGGPRLIPTVLEVRNEHGRAIHPTQKPLGLLRPLVRYSVPPGGLVLDMFAGAASVAVACSLEGRRSISAEKGLNEYLKARQRLDELEICL